jgi:hypothetical protein
MTEQDAVAADIYTATYSPEDDKLRLSAAVRLDEETYKRVDAAGFRWAPKQQVFFAVWSPAREDLLLELAGEIGDEDTSLVQRAEERAGRFDGYSTRRAEEAHRAKAAVAELADGIPFGQPILVGHHSERRARRDAEKIQRGMQQAVRLWDTASYWTDRAAGALRRAKYLERPDVRARRIKKLESERRKMVRQQKDGESAVKVWSTLHEPGRLKRDGVPLTFREATLYVAGNSRTAPMGVYCDLVDEKITPEEAQARAVAAAERAAALAERWVAHLDNRIAYERAMLNEAGGTEADKTRPEKGGAVRCWASPGHGAGWSYIRKVNRVSVTVADSYGPGSRVFTRTMPFDKLLAVMTAAEVEAARAEGRITEAEDGTGFFLAPASIPGPEPAPPVERRSGPDPRDGGEEFDALRDSLRAGVQVVAAPQLFATPAPVGAQVVDLADIQPAQRILEPQAGTGALLELAIRRAFGFECGARVVAVEINHALAEALRERRQKWLYATETNFEVVCADFLSCSVEELGGLFDRIIMNPPFERGADIEHIQHARTFLRPGVGRLVSVCANGPRQRAQLQPLAAEWIDLPAGSFQQAGTNVNTAIVVIEA